MKKSGHFKYITLDEIDSTNGYAAKYVQDQDIPICISAEYQREGKGQPGNKWLSEKSKNLLVSYVIAPRNLLAIKSFYLSKVAAIAVSECLEDKIPDIFIKWPNDVLAGKKKIGGILLENTFSGERIRRSIIGMGVNINQNDFPVLYPEATSLFLETGSLTDREIILEEISLNIEYWLEQLDLENSEIIDREYFGRLYGLGEWRIYESHNQRFEARIIGVKEDGPIILENRQGEKSEYAFKEIIQRLI